jgi:hypothetical protein
LVKWLAAVDGAILHLLNNELTIHQLTSFSSILESFFGFSFSIEVKSCATRRCSTPPGPEGSNGRQRVLCDTGALDLILFLAAGYSGGIRTYSLPRWLFTFVLRVNKNRPTNSRYFLLWYSLLTYFSLHFSPPVSRCFGLRPVGHSPRTGLPF